MYKLLSMVYGLFKPFWLTHATCTCFKETALLFHEHLGYFVNSILCPADKCMFKINNETIRLISWICSKLKPNTTWHRSGVFIVDFDQSHYINTTSLFLTFNKYLSVGCERYVKIFWKQKKPDICFLLKLGRPISFRDLSLYLTEINYEQMTILWTYYRALGSFFVVWETQSKRWPPWLADDEKQKKNNRLKRPKAVPKNEIWTKIWMIQNLIFTILFLKNYLGHTTFLYSSTRPRGHHQSFFIIFRFPSRVSKPTKTSEKDQK